MREITSKGKGLGVKESIEEPELSKALGVIRERRSNVRDTGFPPPLSDSYIKLRTAKYVQRIQELSPVTRSPQKSTLVYDEAQCFDYA